MTTLREIKNLRKQKQILRFEMEAAVFAVEEPFRKKINELSLKIDRMVSQRKTERVRNKV